MNNKEKIGFFISDASLDHKTKVSSIGIVDLTTKENFNIQKSVKDIKEAESTGILESLKIASKRYKNVIVFCDNVFSVNETRKLILSSPYWKNIFYYIQIIWLPREYTHIADFFSKNIEDTDLNKYLKIEAFNKESSRNNISSVLLTREDKIDILIEKIKLLNLKTINFKSSVLNSLFNENIFKDSVNNEIDLIKRDFKLLFVVNSTEKEKDIKEVMEMVFLI